MEEGAVVLERRPRLAPRFLLLPLAAVLIKRERERRGAGRASGWMDGWAGGRAEEWVGRSAAERETRQRLDPSISGRAGGRAGWLAGNRGSFTRQKSARAPADGRAPPHSQKQDQAAAGGHEENVSPLLAKRRSHGGGNPARRRLQRSLSVGGLGGRLGGALGAENALRDATAALVR